MNDQRQQKLPETISLLLGIASLVLTIYFSTQLIFQIIFGVATIIFAIAYFILQNKLQIADLEDSTVEIEERMKKMEESLNVYERLLKLEKEVFTHVKK
ncbi:hypothetical protein HYU21_04710 [Candidatus Woesearchaeota archaeon]|nr:hypothetical protein [Candidatus Woesearchaeota archaeon]